MDIVSDMSVFFPKESGVINLTPDDFEDHHVSHLKSKSCTAVLFYAPWCPWCEMVKPTWSQLGRTVQFMDIAALDCDMYKQHRESIQEEHPGLISSFPTMIIYKHGKPVQKFGETQRDYGDLLQVCMEVCKKKK